MTYVNLNTVAYTGILLGMSQIIHIVDDDASVRGATSFLLSSHGYSTRIYGSGAEFLGQAKLEEGCILLDFRMSDMSGLEVLDRLAECGVSLPVIMLTGHGDVATAVQALQLGAVDFIQKPYEERELISALERALAGGGRDKKRNEARKIAVNRLQPLSEREMQVLRGLVAGMTNKEMARRLGLSPRTVEMHRSTMMSDLGVDSAADAIRIALDAELTPLDQEGEAQAPTAAALAPMAGRRGKALPLAAPKHLEDILPPVLDVLEGSTDCVLLLDRQFNITYMNRNAMETIAPGRDIRGRNIWDLFPGSRQTSAWDAVNRSADERTSTSFEFFAPDGQRWFAVNVRPIPSGLQVFFRDLTAERSADAALKQSEERLRLALEAAGDGTWDWDLRSGRVNLSRGYAQRLDYGETAFDAGLHQIFRLVHPGDQGLLKARIKEHLAGTTENFCCEYRIRARDGVWRWHLDRGRVVERDPVSGVATRMVATSTDISAIKAMKLRMAEADERIKLAQEAAGAGLWEYDMRGGRVKLCPKSREMLGLPEAPEEIGLDQWQAALHPDDLQEAMAVIDEAAASGRAFALTYRVVMPNGDVRSVLGMGKLAGSDRQGPRRMIGLNIDRTERSRANAKLHRLEAELLKAAQTSAIGAMAASLADELNQPLTAITNYVRGMKLSLSRQPGGIDTGAAAALEGAESSAKLASRIVRRIHDKAALLRFDRRPEPLSEMVRDAARVALAGFPQNAVQLKLAIPRQANLVTVDRLQIQHVLVNLIRNAVEAMEGSPAKPELAIEARVGESEAIEVRVTDRGSGSADDVARKLFSPFVSTRKDSTEVGLAVCRTIVEAHGGRIWAEPAPGKGTSIGFTLESGTGTDSGKAAKAA